MTLIKKTISFAIVLIFFVCSFSINTLAVTVYVDDFGFEINNKTKQATIVEYNGTDSDVIIPTKVYDYDVTTIGESLFYNNKTIESIYISSSITTIENNAFSGCVNLVKATIPDTVIQIGTDLFSNCTSLESAEFLADIEVLPKQTFKNCTALENVVLSDSIHRIDNMAFYDCQKLTFVPNEQIVDSIGQSAFYNSGVECYTASDKMSAIDRYTFANCKALTKVVLTMKINSIESTSFKDCDNLTIYCYTDTYSHKFANDNEINYVLLDSVDKGIYGDVDKDGVISVMDATFIQNYVVQRVTFDEIQKLRANVDLDDKISVMDATAIQFHLVSLNLDLPIGQPIL